MKVNLVSAGLASGRRRRQRRMSIDADPAVSGRRPVDSAPQNAPMRTICRAAALLAVLTISGTANAFGAEGHQLIGELAEAQLTVGARAEVTRLLAAEPGATLSSISTWADEIRSRQTASWHYVNLPPENCSYERARDCHDGQCSVEALSRQVAILRSKATDDQRLAALKWVVHLVGDLHQPLHAGFKGDKGGNLYQVRAFGRGTNLHSLWDSGLIRNRAGGLNAMRTAAATTGVAAATEPRPANWAIESCKIVASPGFYPDEHFIKQTYVDQWDPVLVSRLKAAAQRLAATLNEALHK